MRRYYKISFVYKKKKYYTLWFNNDIDGLLNKNKKIILFKSDNEMINYSINNNIKVKEDKIVNYNVDRIKIIIKNIKLMKDEKINCKYILGIWNIIGDIVRTNQTYFSGDLWKIKNKKLLLIYDKIFFGNNLPALRGDGEIYIPIFNNNEIKNILNILEECYGIFVNMFKNYI